MDIKRINCYGAFNILYSERYKSCIRPSNKNEKYTKKNPLETNILTNQKITGRNSEKDIRHIEINLEESGLKYTPGDSLGVWFKNDQVLTYKIRLVVSRLMLTKLFSKENEPLTILDALIYEFEITQLRPGFVKNMRN